MNAVIHDVGRSSGGPARVVGSLSTTKVKSPPAAAGALAAGADSPGATDAGAADGVAPPHALTRTANTASSANPRRFVEIIRISPPHASWIDSPVRLVRSMIHARDGGLDLPIRPVRRGSRCSICGNRRHRVKCASALAEAWLLSAGASGVLPPAVRFGTPSEARWVLG